MGRKPKIAANANKSSGPTMESMKFEQTRLSSLPSKKNASNSSLSSKKASSNMNVVVRRSGRLRHKHKAVPNQQRIVEQIDLVDSQDEEESLVQQLDSEPIVQQLDSEPVVQQLNSELISNQHNLEEKIDYSEPIISGQPNLEEKIDFVVQCVEEFKSQVKRRPFPSETQSVELNYRSLYIESQKKIQALTEENHQLAQSLHFVNGKVEAFEQMKDVFGNLKDIMLISNLERATEAAMKSAQAVKSKFNLPETTTHDAAVPVDEQRTTFPETHKKYGRKKK